MSIPQNNYSKLDLYQGTDFIRAIRVAEIDGAPESLVGYTLAAQMRKNYESKKFWVFFMKVVIVTFTNYFTRTSINNNSSVITSNIT